MNILNYFALKMFLQIVFHNVAIYLFKYFVSHVTVIPQNDAFLYLRTNRISCLVSIMGYPGIT